MTQQNNEEITKLKGELKALKDKYKAKCERNSKLIKDNKRLIQERGRAWNDYYEASKERYELRKVIRNMPHYYFTIVYKVDNYAPSAFSECVHDVVPDMKIKALKKLYPGLVLVSVTKTA